jgi:GNAT superfamily N-acetyltransferase
MSEQPAVSIRRYAEKDGPAVRALFIQVNRELAPSAMRDQFELYIARALREEIDRIEAYYAERKGSFWIAEDSTGLLGTFGLERVDKGTAELRRMYVAPRARRCGIARMMLEHAERVCRDAGYDALVLSTSELQQAALQLYRTSGFKLVREEVATAASNKTVGSGLRRFHFEKPLKARC